MLYPPGSPSRRGHAAAQEAQLLRQTPGDPG